MDKQNSDSLSLRQLLFQSYDIDLQLMDFINEAVLHLQDRKRSIRTKTECFFKTLKQH